MSLKGRVASASYSFSPASPTVTVIDRNIGGLTFRANPPIIPVSYTLSLWTPVSVSSIGFRLPRFPLTVVNTIRSYRTRRGLHLRRVQVTLRAATIDPRLELRMKKPVPVESASASIDEKVRALGDWRGRMLAKLRAVLHEADPEIVEEWKWVKPTSPGTPVWSQGGIVCTGETYKNVVKMTFARGAALKDPSGLFNSSLAGNVRRAIDLREGDHVDEAALKDLIRAAVALNLKGKSKPKPRRASSKRAN
jgi:hypothetical protein